MKLLQLFKRRKPIKQDIKSDFSERKRSLMSRRIMPKNYFNDSDTSLFI